jgi:alkanesulfonate monooxygenase SsuD/methylene tetrahydromethanopterin reductase-like flavin-dependent oxidoreductase (luciferase family)
MAVGYRPEEFEHHGADFHQRGKLVDGQLALLMRAKTGEPFEHEGRHIHVTPAPVTVGGPPIIWGGGSAPAAKRAGRNGLDFIAQGGGAALEEVYIEAARASGHEPGFCMIPPLDMATTIFVAHDLDRAWAEVGPHLLHDVMSYSAINEGNTHTASLSTATSVDELRAEDRTHRIVSVDEAVEMIRGGMPLPLQPLVGGLPPEIAWRYLRVVTDDVMAAIATDG